MNLKIDINFSLIRYIIGAFLIIEAVFLLLPGVTAVVYQEIECLTFFSLAVVLAVFGLLLIRREREHTNSMSRQDGYIVVLSLWLISVLVGTIPYLVGEHLHSFIDAFFESMSGITTTGATLLPDLEHQTHGILLWRSLMQWMGGMGIITLSLILLPAMGIGGMHLFAAETSVVRSDKIHPKITEMAKAIWIIYVVLTVVEITLLWLADMPLFDAICHSLSTVSTGGFSTRSASIEAFNSPLVEYIIMIFMFLGGVNFVLFYSIILRKGERFVQDEELKYYIITFFTIALVVATIGLVCECYDDSEEALRHALFQVLSFMTSTGFTSANYLHWPTATLTLLGLLMLTGTCTGSTSGGIKLMRLITMFRTIRGGFHTYLHPSIVTSTKYNGKPLERQEVSNIMMFIVLYILIMFIGMILISLFGFSFEDSFGLAANSLGNIGITIGSYGYTASLADLPAVVKLVMSALMLIGRLEIFTVILIFTPSFWKR